MFLEFDRILHAYDRLVKIKCIGDCYMNSGGIFDTEDDPAGHTKQMVSFGIDIINALRLLNIELHETLRMRVGVNTGGPIVAGVLGIDKPTFDILGPAICLASKMEQKGVPMNVHIPEHLYLLIKDENFQFKERGEVEVKGVTYRTLIVTGYDDKA
jgi:class 3 adenylate cyclase